MRRYFLAGTLSCAEDRNMYRNSTRNALENIWQWSGDDKSTYSTDHWDLDDLKNRVLQIFNNGKSYPTRVDHQGRTLLLAPKFHYRTMVQFVR
jgi:hypothetical protein